MDTKIARNNQRLIKTWDRLLVLAILILHLEFFFPAIIILSFLVLAVGSLICEGIQCPNCRENPNIRKVSFFNYVRTKRDWHDFASSQCGNCGYDLIKDFSYGDSVLPKAAEVLIKDKGIYDRSKTKSYFKNKFDVNPYLLYNLESFLAMSSPPLIWFFIVLSFGIEKGVFTILFYSLVLSSTTIFLIFKQLGHTCLCPSCHKDFGIGYKNYLIFQFEGRKLFIGKSCPHCNYDLSKKHKKDE